MQYLSFEIFNENFFQPRYTWVFLRKIIQLLENILSEVNNKKYFSVPITRKQIPLHLLWSIAMESRSSIGLFVLFFKVLFITHMLQQMSWLLQRNSHKESIPILIKNTDHFSWKRNFRFHVTHPFLCDNIEK